MALLGVALLVVYATLWRAWRTRVAHSLTPAAARLRANQALVIGVALVALAFTLTFRALPAHYLLDILPLIPVLELRPADAWRSGWPPSSAPPWWARSSRFPPSGRRWSRYRRRPWRC